MLLTEIAAVRVIGGSERFFLGRTQPKVKYNKDSE